MAAGDLTTLANVREWLQQQPAITANDALLTRLISAASQYMQSLMTRTIAVAAYSEARNGMGMDSMMLKNQPIVSVESVYVDGMAIPPRPALGPGVTVSPWGYTFDKVMLYLSGYRFTPGRQNVLINYHGGYAVTPPDLEQACIDIVGEWFKYRDRIGKTSEGIEGQSISFADIPLPKRAAGIIVVYNNKSPVY